MTAKEVIKKIDVCMKIADFDFKEEDGEVMPTLTQTNDTKERLNHVMVKLLNKDRETASLLKEKQQREDRVKRHARSKSATVQEQQ